jgi:hypothetical protein
MVDGLYSEIHDFGYRPSTIDRPSTLVCHSFAPQTRRIIWRQRPNHRSLPSHPPPTPPIDAHRPDRDEDEGVESVCMADDEVEGEETGRGAKDTIVLSPKILL